MEANKPENLVRSWLKNLPTDIESAKRHVRKVKTTSGMPDDIKAEYQEKFTAQEQCLAEFREQFETAQTNGAYEDVDMKKAKAQVVKLAKTVKEWEAVVKVYDGKS